MIQTFSLIGALLLSGCRPAPTDSDPDTDPVTDTDAVDVPEACVPVLADAALTLRLEQLAGLTEPSWPGFAPADGTLVWTQTVASGTCAVLWHDGGLRGVALLDQAPALAFGAYGWMLPEDLSAAFGDFLDQPAEFRDWVDAHGADRATVLPVASEYAALVQLQLALHESFHVEVQADGWFAASDAWLSWADLSVDREGTLACYAGWQAERDALVGGLSGDCDAAHAYLGLRDARRAELADTTVTADAESVSCLQAERVWEANEGLADEASWGVLHRAGLASDEALLDYLGAQADFPPYQSALIKTRWMEAAGTDLMEGFDAMLAADTVDANLDALFEQQVALYCDE